MGTKKYSDRHSSDLAQPKGSDKKSKGDRELIDTCTDKRYVGRDEQGQFKESDDVGRSLSQDVTRRDVKAGQGDRGDAKSGRSIVKSGRGDRVRQAAERRRLSEDEVERLLEAQGVITLPSVSRPTAPRPAPIDVPGAPLSETIIEERR